MYISKRDDREGDVVENSFVVADLKLMSLYSSEDTTSDGTRRGSRSC